MYKKFKATNIFTGTELLPSNKVLIALQNGTITDIVDADVAGNDIEVFDGIICPGFVNAHCHLELSHLKNIIPQHTGMVGFINHILQKRNNDIDFIEECIDKAETEMIENGIVAVGDICNTTHTLKQKRKGKLYYHNFIEISGFVPQTAQQRFNAGIEIYNQFAAYFPNQTSLVPHAPYSVSNHLFNLISNFSNNTISTIHNQESVDEHLFFTTLQGNFLNLYKTLGIDISFFNTTYNSSVEHYINNFKNSAKTILVHNTFTQLNDIELIKYTLKTQFYLCICVIANRYITNCIPNFELLFTQDNIVIGTDSLASNADLNILHELQTIYKEYNNIKIETLLKYATLNGAKALSITEKFGTFNVGTTPGILLIKDFINDKKPTILL